MSVIDSLIEQFANIPTERQIILGSPEQRTRRMELPQISVRDYLNLIPTFDGQPSKLSTFINACENVFPLMAPDNEPQRIRFTMLHIRNKLIGKADALLAARQFSTFPELKHLLISLFGDQRNEESLLSDLNTLRQQPKETALQFADRCIDVRCLLLSKLSCQDMAREIKLMKIDLYNNFTLRAFLTGVNPQLSHLLRCRRPLDIEEAIQIVTEEENINYHRSKINDTPQNSGQHNNISKPNAHQLRINTPQTRIPQNNFYQPPNRFQQQNWIPKPPPMRFPFSQTQQGPSQYRTQQNNFAPRAANAPTPMEVDSRRTRLTNQMSTRTIPQRPQQNWRTEQLHVQQSEELEQSNPSTSDPYYTNDPVYLENEECYYEEYPPYETYEQENVNFQTTASESDKPN